MASFMIEEWRKTLNNNQTIGWIATDQSKSLSTNLLIFECPNDDVSHTHCPCPANHMCQARSSNKNSEWCPNDRGVAQDSILGPSIIMFIISTIVLMPIPFHFIVTHDSHISWMQIPKSSNLSMQKKCTMYCQCNLKCPLIYEHQITW